MDICIFCFDGFVYLIKQENPIEKLVALLSAMGIVSQMVRASPALEQRPPPPPPARLETRPSASPGACWPFDFIA